LPAPPTRPARRPGAAPGNYTHQVSMDAHGAHQSYRGNYLDLDPTYRDAYGQPLLRMTFDWQENDIKMNQFMVDKLSKIAQAMNPRPLRCWASRSVTTSTPPATRPPT
jgi:gluconate 2-dehydrogenase alpha chain